MLELLLSVRSMCVSVIAVVWRSVFFRSGAGADVCMLGSGRMCHVLFPKQPCNAQVMHFVEWQERILCNNTSSNRVCGDKDW